MMEQISIHRFPIAMIEPDVFSKKIKKVRFTKEQDEMIIRLVNESKAPVWSDIATYIEGKNGKQCRERYQHFLAPNIRRQLWTKEEDFQLIQAHHFIGSDWATIAKLFPGRTNHDVKNRYNSHLKDKEIDTFLDMMLLRDF